MTVVVAAYEFSSMRKWKFDPSFNWEDLETPKPSPSDATDTPVQSNDEVEKELAHETPSLAILIADSVLSTRSGAGALRTVSAREECKIRKVSIEVSVPDFTPDGYVTGNHIPHLTHSCGVAYCGNHFTFGQVMNKFVREMEALVYTWNRATGVYQIVGRNSDLALKPRSDQTFDESIDFRSHDLPGLDAACVVANLQACIQSTINDIFAARIEQGIDDGASLHTEFALALYCEYAKRPRIFHLDIVSDRDAFPEWFKVETRELRSTEILVLGKPSWKSAFETQRAMAVGNNQSIFSALHRECERRVRAEEVHNYVGGEVACGHVDQNGFAFGHPKTY